MEINKHNLSQFQVDSTNGMFIKLGVKDCRQ